MEGLPICDFGLRICDWEERRGTCDFRLAICDSKGRAPDGWEVWGWNEWESSPDLSGLAQGFGDGVMEPMRAGIGCDKGGCVTEET